MIPENPRDIRAFDWSLIPDMDLSNMKMLCVFEVIRWLKGVATLEQITHLVSKNQVAANEVGPIIDSLLKKKVIQKRDKRFMALTDTIFAEDGAQNKMYSMFSVFRRAHLGRKAREH